MPEAPHHILIADDHEENRYILARILRSAGYDCSEAATGTQTLVVARSQPDLIILDVRLPDMSGYEVCQRLKIDSYTASIPVLQISAAFVSTEDRVRALDGGADDYLTHPIDRTVLIATVRSLLRLRMAEQRARKTAVQWASTFDALSEGLAILDDNNSLVRWNTAFEAICASEFKPEPGKNATEFLARLTGITESSMFSGSERFTTEFALESRSMLLSIGPIASSGKRNEKILIVSDITDRRLAEYAVRTAEKLAATGKLANAIAHEINNPLEALTNLIFLAHASEEIGFVKTMLERANQELERISRITKQTLAFHRDTQNPTPVDLAELLAEVIAFYEKPSSAKRVRLVADIRPTPPILGYPGQLNQVFSNLVRNATEAAPSGSDVVVRVRQVHRGGRPEARITIRDYGRGIPRSVQQKIFDPFFTTKELKGSGLGLWVSKSLIARHDGAIRFRTSERAGRNGTIFAVFLPLAQETGEASGQSERELLSA
jgi:two-component system, NtrC family, sensor kinase